MIPPRPMPQMPYPQAMVRPQMANPSMLSARTAPAMPMRAEGGSIDRASKIAKEKGTPCHEGLITMAVGGRTDHIPMNVLEGSYVLPADIVSGLGEGNTLAGSKIIDNMFSSSPMGVKTPNFRATAQHVPQISGWQMAPTQQDVNKPQAASGGLIRSGTYKPVPIVAAGGEYVIHPDVVKRVGGGDMNRGHEWLDHFVKGVRKHLIKTLSKLPGPKRD